MSESDYEQMRERPAWLIPLILIIILIVLTVIVLVRYFAPSVEEITGAAPVGSEAALPVNVSVAGRAFAIPEHYTRIPKERSGGVQEIVHLHALLPDLEPYTNARAEEFADLGPDSKVLEIDLHVDRNPLTEAERFERVYLNFVENAAGEDAPYGLTRYTFRPDTPYKHEELWVRREENELVVLRCLKATDRIRAPYCRRDAEVMPGVVVSYRFKRPFLHSWRDIDTRVRRLVASFRVGAGQRSAAPSTAPAEPGSTLTPGEESEKGSDDAPGKTGGENDTTAPLPE